MIGIEKFNEGSQTVTQLGQYSLNFTLCLVSTDHDFHVSSSSSCKLNTSADSGYDDEGFRSDEDDQGSANPNMTSDEQAAKGDMKDEVDGTVILMTPAQREVTELTTARMEGLLTPAERAESVWTRRKMERAEERPTAKSRMSSYILSSGKRFFRRCMYKCRHRQEKVKCCEQREVTVHNTRGSTNTDYDAHFGMNLKSISENGIIRHFISKRAQDSLAGDLCLDDDDELLVLNDHKVVGASPVRVHKLFHTLPQDEPITLDIRRAHGIREGQVEYQYIHVTATIHVFEGTDAEVFDCIEEDARAGVEDVYDPRFKRSDRRSIRSHNDVMLKIKSGDLHLGFDKNNQEFFFDLLWYEAVQVLNDSCRDNVSICIIRYCDDTTCHTICHDENGRVFLTKNEKDTVKIEWSDMEPGMKWITKIPERDKPFIFQCLTNTDMFLSIERGTLQCLEKVSWDDAQTDTCTHFYVKTPTP